MARKAEAGRAAGSEPTPADIHNRIKFPVTMAGGSHLFPSRTQKLSLQTLMVLGWQRPGRVGSRRIQQRGRKKQKCGFLLRFFGCGFHLNPWRLLDFRELLLYHCHVAVCGSAAVGPPIGERGDARRLHENKASSPALPKLSISLRRAYGGGASGRPSSLRAADEKCAAKVGRRAVGYGILRLGGDRGWIGPSE